MNTQKYYFAFLYNGISLKTDRAKVSSFSFFSQALNWFLIILYQCNAHGGEGGWGGDGGGGWGIARKFGN